MGCAGTFNFCIYVTLWFLRSTLESIVLIRQTSYGSFITLISLCDAQPKYPPCATTPNIISTRALDSNQIFARLCNSGLSPGKATTIIESVISTILSGSTHILVSFHTPFARFARQRIDLQTRFACPVPTFNVTNLTTLAAIVTAPSANVTVTPLEALNMPCTSNTSGTAYTAK
jgi:hypothetical protein